MKDGEDTSEADMVGIAVNSMKMHPLYFTDRSKQEMVPGFKELVLEQKRRHETVIQSGPC